MKSDPLTKILLAVIAVCMCAIVVKVWLPSSTPPPSSIGSVPSTQPGAPKFEHVQVMLGPLGGSGWEENFIREGRALRQWLPELLGSEPATRRRAENAVSAMYWGAPVADKTVHEHRSTDFHTHQKIWGGKVSDIFADPEFAALEFLRSAVSRMKADADLTSRRFELEQQVLFDDPALDPDATPLDPGTKASLMEELKRLHTEERAGRLPNSLGPYMLRVVVENAGSALLRDPQMVRDALRDSVCCRTFAKALEKIGVDAVAFAPDLMSRDEPSASEHGIPFPAALAAVARHDRATIAELVNRLGSETPREAYSAAETLSAIGTDAVLVRPTLVDELLPLMDQPETLNVVLVCIGALAPDRRDVFETVLAAARRSPPQIRTQNGYTYDVVMTRRGIAMDALGHFTAFAKEAVPVLVDALDSFEEYDPDWGYENGNYGRIVSALSKLGPASAGAIPALLGHLRDSNGDVEWPIVRLLGKLGPAARETLPVLKQLEAEEKSRSLLTVEGPPNEAIHPVAWAIYHITGWQTAE